MTSKCPICDDELIGNDSYVWCPGPPGRDHHFAQDRPGEDNLSPGYSYFAWRLSERCVYVVLNTATYQDIWRDVGDKHSVCKRTKTRLLPNTFIFNPKDKQSIIEKIELLLAYV